MYHDARIVDVTVDDGNGDMNSMCKVHGQAEHLAAIPEQRAEEASGHAE